MSEDCPFCRPAADRLFHLGEHVLGIWDSYPVSPGHSLLVPKRHIASWFEATAEEQRELFGAIDVARSAIEQTHRPDGFNVGVNIGASAGQTVPHLHVHVIPRYSGDMADPRGGVRGVIPQMQNYLREAPDGSSVVRDREEVPTVSDLPALIRGGEDDPLLPHLKIHLDAAMVARLAVAFVLPSGVDLLDEHLRDLCSRGGRLQFLTGDYQGVTDPDALERLLDIQAQYEDRVELRVYSTTDRSFHPKTYIFEGAAEGGVAFVGSSNLTRTALIQGVEWNYRVVPARDAIGFAEVVEGFEALFSSPSTVTLDQSWIDAYRNRRPDVKATSTGDRVEVDADPPEPPPEPHDVQKEALTALEGTRAEGARAGLVVLATGLGKTWLSAFDSSRPEFRRVLFVAHREEILGQAMKTFRRIRPTAKLGLYTGTQKDEAADVLFASVQTLSRETHLRRFDRRAFDYLIVDEFHHASARTYRRLIDYFEPKFLLGLTATPERTDGGDLLSLCGENLVFRCGVREAIERGFLSSFRYFGVPDDVDYSNIPWRSNRFDEEQLTTAVATQDRAQNALEQLQQHGGDKVLAFCCSKRHADYMRDFFVASGIKAAAVHSGEGSDPRAGSLEKLESGELQVVFAVDMFNEGVDIPHVDTVLMLRPTDSQLLWTQQFGRGLRKAEGKRDLAVIDYIGNHRSFLLKVQALFELVPGDQHVREVLERLQSGTANLPPGCEVTYELETIDLLRSLLREPTGGDVVRSYYETFRELNGRRPTASEALHDGYSPRAAARGYGSWLRFVEAMGDLSEASELIASHQAAGTFLEGLESTPMTRSYKMLVLLAMLEEERFPGQISIEELTSAVERVARRSPVLVGDVGPSIDSQTGLQRHLEENPIAAWTGGRGTGGRSYFAYRDGAFESTFDVLADQADTFSELVRELAEFRLAEYLARPRVGAAEGGRFQCRVSHASGKPIIRLPDRERVEGIPEDWVPVDAAGESFEANFVKVAVNVMRRPGGEANVLAEVLQSWFGPDAGKPGTRQLVEFAKVEGRWLLAPAGEGTTGVTLWDSYPRQEVAERFGHDYSRNWGQGVVRRGEEFFFFVTLEKSNLPEEHRYGDRFLSRDVFEWQSQNRTRRDSGTGERFQHHMERGITIHLFIRKHSKIDGKGAPFVYCGPLEFIDWEGDQPITIRWRLSEAVPDSLWPIFEPPA
jgi:superfamily II DNA or RNA helicase/HKD family nuclease/diadenosine tetraphosphate (Ap4A) HIT family hydrolase